MLKITRTFKKVFPSISKAIDGFLIILTISSISFTSTNKDINTINNSPTDMGMNPVKTLKSLAIPLNIKFE
jgi:hypothetical protein